MEPKFEPKPGEREFLQRLETHPQFETITKESSPEKSKEKIRETLKELEKEIEGIDEIKEEAEIHHEPVGNISNVLARAINIALEDGVQPGLKFLQQTGSFYLVDAYHDLLAGHFYDSLVKQGKIKLEK